MIESIMAFPAETEGRGNQPLTPEVLADGTKRFELTASVVDWEVRPGEIVQAWAYNGMVPGPRIDSTSATGSRWRSRTSCRSAPTSTGTASTSPTTRTACPPSRRSWCQR